MEIAVGAMPILGTVDAGVRLAQGQGTYEEVFVSLAGDVATFATLGVGHLAKVAKATKSAGALANAKKLRTTALLANAGVFGYSSVRGAQEFANGNITSGGLYTGTAFLQLVGATPAVRRQLMKLAKSPTGQKAAKHVKEFLLDERGSVDPYVVYVQPFHTLKNTVSYAFAKWTAPIGRRLGTLRSIGQNAWQSARGLRYVGLDPDERNRVQHVLLHVDDIPGRPGKHGVFDAGRSAVFGLLDEAWGIAKNGGPRVVSNQQGNRTVYIVDMGRRVGYVGGQVGAAAGHPVANHVFIVIENADEVITAFPIIP